MNKTFSYKIRLFVLKILETTNVEEEKELESWAKEKENYHLLLADLTKPEEYRKRQQQLQSIQTDAEFECFIQARRSSRHPLRRSYWQVAAIVIPFLIGSVITWQLFPKVTVNNRITQATTVSPGVSGATLILSDGTRQALSPDTRLFTESNGTKIQTDSNRLNYSKGNIAVDDTATIYNHLAVGRGYEYMLVLQDGTKVWMNSESELHYPVHFPGNTRKVQLQGEAYFEVARDSARPFIVEVNKGFEVKVLGTHFNIKAYPTDDQAETTLLEGKIAISAPSLTESIILTPSQQMVIGKNGENKVRQVNPENAIAWHNGWFYFDNETLEKTLEQIGRWYNLGFTFGDAECKTIRVSGKVKRFENLKVLLDMLKTTTKCNYIIENQKIYVTKK